MAISEHEADELLDMLSEIWDRGATPERVRAVEEFARKHGAEAHDLILELTGVHANLTASVSSARAYHAATAAVLAEALVENAEPATLSIRPRESRVKPARLTLSAGASRRMLVVTSLAAAILAAMVVLSWGPNESAVHDTPLRVAALRIQRPSQPVACIISENSAVWSPAKDFDAGETLHQGQQLNLLEGQAQISMACGADIILQAPCRVALVADDVVRLDQGSVEAQAAKWATGFVIETEGLKITDLGTRFAVSANSDGVAEAHVLEGTVLAEPLKSVRPKRSSMLLKEGQAIRVDLPKSTIDLIAAKRSQLIDHMTSFRPLRPISIFNTGLGQQIGSADPNWTVVAGDAANVQYPMPAIVTQGDPVYLDNMPDASQWISVSADQQAPPDSVYTFETKFDLTGYDLATVQVVGLFLVDDAINSLRINGRNVPFERWESSWDRQDFQKFRAIPIAEGFVPGENTISIEIYNAPSRPEHPTSSNPVGMRIEWQAFGCEAEDVEGSNPGRLHAPRPSPPGRLTTTLPWLASAR